MPEETLQDKPQIDIQALTVSQVAVKTKKVDEFAQKIADKEAMKARLISSHEVEVARLQAEIDEHALIKAALDSLK